jgi:hypothetical protein
MRFLLTFLGCHLAALFLPFATPAETLLAGVARVDITPPLSMQAALGGYGARMSRPAVGVHDSVWAKAVVLSQGERRFAIVTADLLGFPYKFKAALMERMAPAGWSEERILLLPSHSHTSLDLMALHPANEFGIPQVGVFQKSLFDFTLDRLEQVISNAGRTLITAQAATRTVELSRRNRNRRGGSVTEPELIVTRIDRTDGNPLAVLVNWTAHPTIMNESDMLFSGDWPGHLQRTLEALIGNRVTVLYYNGAEGDQSPQGPDGGGSRWERAERYGREIGIEAWHAWNQTTPQPGAPLQFMTVPVKLPQRQTHPDFMKTGGAEYGLKPERMPEFLSKLLPTETHCTALRLGELVLIGVPGEMTAELGQAMKLKARASTGAAHVAIGGLADEWISYILSPAEYRRGGYEASMSNYGEALAEQFLKLELKF